MPLRDDLLNPIAGDNPSGVSLRYERVYDQIKEARTEDDESLPSGDWQRQVKRADYPLVIKLAGEALANKSKDLQLAAWLAEAHVKREGIGLMQPCLKLFQDLQEQFWDTLHPEIEDGDAGMRAVPIEWAANRIASLSCRKAPITRDGLNFFQYKESRAVGYEAEAEASDAKAAARERGHCRRQDHGRRFRQVLRLHAEDPGMSRCDASMHLAGETWTTLQAFCDEKYGDDSPGFGKLRNALEEVGNVVSILLAEKRKLEPDAPVEEEIGEAYAEPEPAAEVSRRRLHRATCRTAQNCEHAERRADGPRRRHGTRAGVRAISAIRQSGEPHRLSAGSRHCGLRKCGNREAGRHGIFWFLRPPRQGRI